MTKEVFDLMLKDADTFNTGDLWIATINNQNLYFNITKKSRWWIEAYCVTDHTNYRICRYK